MSGQRANEQLFHVGVKAVIRNTAGQVLLLKADVSSHRKNTEPYWDLPGGRIQEGHYVLQTLAREVEEETGIREFTAPQLLAVTVSNHRIPLNEHEEVALLLVIFSVRVGDGTDIVISPEHTSFEWVGPDEANLRLKDKYPLDLPL